MNAVDCREVKFAFELSCSPHRRQRRGDEVFDHAMGMPNLGMNSVARGGEHQLFGGRADRGLNLPPRILDERFENDRAHLVVETVESAKPIEYARAPEEL